MVDDPMPRPSRDRSRSGAYGSLALVVAVLGLGWLVWTALAPPVQFDERRFASLASAGRFDEAEALVADHLRARPEDGLARFLLAQLMLERPDLTDEELRDAAVKSLSELERAVEGRGADAAEVALYRGKALYQLKRWDDAEAAWIEAIKLDPAVPEAGWALLDLYYLEGRRREARELALSMFEVEPLPRDRAQLLLELVRSDAIRPDPISLVPEFESVVEAQDRPLHSRIGLGLALVRSGQAERGLEELRKVLETHPDSPAGWDGMLSGLELAGQASRIGEFLSRMPVDLAASPRFERHRGLVAEEEGRWVDAVSAYRRSLEFDPPDFETGVRLARALRFAGEPEQADDWEERIQSYRSAARGLLALYELADATKTLGVGPNPELTSQLAESRTRMWHVEEAEHWRKLEAQAGRRPT